MLQNYNTSRILELFFNSPTKSFQLREISRLTKISLPSVINHVKVLEKEGLVKKEKINIYYSYKANKTDRFKLYKKVNLLLRLHDSGLVKFLEEKLSPNAIVLFGSASRGEDIEKSDIDLCILAAEEELNLKIFEKELKRKINLFFESSFNEIPLELKNNLINGIILSGYLKVWK